MDEYSPTIADGDAPTPVDFGQEVADALHRLDDAEKNSHIEVNPNVFHASSMGYSPWMIVAKKYGLIDNDTASLGRMRGGTIYHSFLEDHLNLPSMESEYPVSVTDSTITFTGRADYYDPEMGAIYDIKTRSNWYKFEPPIQRHIDQLLIYMRATESRYGQIVYVHKGSMEVRTWPEEGFFVFDPDRYAELLAKAITIRNDLLESGVPLVTDQIPYSRSDDWIEQNTTLKDWDNRDDNPVDTLDLLSEPALTLDIELPPQLVGPVTTPPKQG